MKSINKKIISILLFANCTIVSFTQENNYRITERIIPVQYTDIYNFLESLKRDTNNLFGYEKEDGLKYLINTLSSDGVFFTDPNEELNDTISNAQIEEEMKRKDGKSYDMISQMISIYSMPYKQYSELKFTKTENNETIVEIGYMFKLTFENMENVFLLKSIEYLKLEVD